MQTPPSAQSSSSSSGVGGQTELDPFKNVLDYYINMEVKLN
jgi:hypothetical protein